jgi:hypothetical protein
LSQESFKKQVLPDNLENVCTWQHHLNVERMQCERNEQDVPRKIEVKNKSDGQGGNLAAELRRRLLTMNSQL